MRAGELFTFFMGFGQDVKALSRGAGKRDDVTAVAAVIMMTNQICCENTPGDKEGRWLWYHGKGDRVWGFETADGHRRP